LNPVAASFCHVSPLGRAAQPHLRVPMLFKSRITRGVIDAPYRDAYANERGSNRDTIARQALATAAAR
jgi:hypothetical protein